MGGGVGVGDGIVDKVVCFAFRGAAAYDGGFRVLVEIVGLRRLWRTVHGGFLCIVPCQIQAPFRTSVEYFSAENVPSRISRKIWLWCSEFLSWNFFSLSSLEFCLLLDFACFYLTCLDSVLV